MDHILELFHSEHDDNLLDVDLQMLQDWPVVAPPSRFYTVSTLLFHKYGGANVAATNCMSHFSIFVPTKDTVKLANVNTVHAQVIGIILCRFPNCFIVYPVGPVYYFPGHPSNNISSGDLKFYNCQCTTKFTVKLYNGNTGHYQGIGIILWRFPNCSIIYLVGPVYYCPGHPYNTISSGAFKFYVGF